MLVSLSRVRFWHCQEATSPSKLFDPLALTTLLHLKAFTLIAHLLRTPLALTETVLTPKQ